MPLRPFDEYPEIDKRFADIIANSELSAIDAAALAGYQAGYDAAVTFAKVELVRNKSEAHRVADLLCRHNQWLRSDKNIDKMLCSFEIGAAIDDAVKMLRLPL